VADAGGWDTVPRTSPVEISSLVSVYVEGDYGNYLSSMVLKEDGFTPTGRQGARDVSNASQTIFNLLYLFS